MPTSLFEYIVIVAALYFVVEKVATRIQVAIRRHRKKALKDLHSKLHEISEAANLQADFLWDAEAKRLTEAHVQKREQAGTLPVPSNPFMGAAEVYTHQIKACFIGYVHAQIMKPHVEQYFELSKKLIDEDSAKEMTEEFTESVDKARETLRDAGFDLEQLDKQLVAA